MLGNEFLGVIVVFGLGNVVLVGLGLVYVVRVKMYESVVM